MTSRSNLTQKRVSTLVSVREGANTAKLLAKVAMVPAGTARLRLRSCKSAGLLSVDEGVFSLTDAGAAAIATKAPAKAKLSDEMVDTILLIHDEVDTVPAAVMDLGEPWTTIQSRFTGVVEAGFAIRNRGSGTDPYTYSLTEKGCQVVQAVALRCRGAA